MTGLDIVDRLLNPVMTDPLRREAAAEIQKLRRDLEIKDAVIEHMQACYVREANREIDDADHDCWDRAVARNKLRF